MFSIWLLVKKPPVQLSHQPVFLTTKNVASAADATIVATIGPTTSINIATSATATAAAVTWGEWYDELVPVPKMIK